MLDVDAEIAAAMKKVDRVIDRVVHFDARSAGQQRRRERERQLAVHFWRGPHGEEVVTYGEVKMPSTFVCA